MKNKFIFSMIAVLISAIFFTSCSDNDDPAVAKACLVSASSLTFSSENAGEKLVTVYSDGAWRVEAPEWITVTPTSGVGTTDVTISVTDNLRDGSIDNPRKASVQFRGDLLMSIATLIVIQEGDKYRDVKQYTVSEIGSLTDETVLSFNGVVSSVTASGFYVADSNYGIFFKSSTPVAVGDEIYVQGEKATDKFKFPYVSCDNVSIQESNQAAILPEVTDITNSLDTYTSTNNTYVKVTGALDGSIMTVADATLTVQLDDVNSALGLSALNGHNITVEGWFDGVSSPVVRVIPATITDLGINEVIYWVEDFEWLDPWSVAGEAGKTVETDNLNATAPAITTPKVDGVTALAALEAQGYTFSRVTTKTSGECIYLQQNYLKFGKTSYQAGITLPSITTIPEGTNVKISFDWCPMRQASGTVDPVELVVIVANGSDEVQFGPFVSGMSSGQTLAWINVSVDLTGVTVDQNTKITIRNSDEQWPIGKAMRWFLDNIKIAQVK